MKTIVLLLGLGLLVLGVVGGAVLATSFRANRELRQANGKLHAELQQSLLAAENLREETTRKDQQLAAAQETLHALQARLAESETLQSAEATNAGPPRVSPFQAPAYLG